MVGATHSVFLSKRAADELANPALKHRRVQQQKEAQANMIRLIGSSQVPGPPECSSPGAYILCVSPSLIW
jgi:hypothetical protein